MEEQSAYTLRVNQKALKKPLCLFRSLDNLIQDYDFATLED